MLSKKQSTENIKNVYTIAFYNLENLFDTKDDPLTLDDDFTPEGRKHWNYKRYKKKIKKLGSVIAQIGKEKSLYSPAIVGVVEVENSTVVEDLVNSKYLSEHHYGYVHHDSSDERGIDVALLYKKELFEFISSKTYPVYLEEENGVIDYTRDILMVKGKLNGELTYIIVNHWPSKREGGDVTEWKRIKAAEMVLNIVDFIENETPNAKIIIMGDFNDDPTSKSVKNHLVNGNLYNPMESLIKKGKGTLNHDKTWHLFDQIIFSKNFFDQKEGKHTFKYAEVFDKHFLKVWNGKLKGNPFRTYVGKWYKGGFSDHFPVYIYVTKN